MKSARGGPGRDHRNGGEISMSLRMALLVLLAVRPMTGFDLLGLFETSVGQLWHAPQTQIYPELKKLELAGLIAGEDRTRGQKGTKREYRLTEAGSAELRAVWNTVEPPRRERDPYRLKSAYFEWADPESVRAQLTAHLEFFKAEESLRRQQRDDILRRNVPFMRDRLRPVPEDQHEAIIEFKAFAFSGLISKARCEVEWAQEGLRLLDRLGPGAWDPNVIAEQTMKDQTPS